MRTIKSLLLVCGFALIAQLGFGQISGTKHDFSAAAWNATTEICIVCHTPHNADITVAEAPLWNHETTATATFTLYNTGTFNGSGTIGQPDGSSKLCLSCHDGITAVDAYGTVGGVPVTTGQNMTTLIPGSDAGFGTDLTNDHPISFTYNTALATADGELYDPATQPALGGTIDTKMLFAGQMECASCHDVHNKAVAGTKMLHIDNAGSQLCLTCHNK